MTRCFILVACLCALIVSAHTACLLVPNLDINQGVLAAIPGTKLSDLRRESTLNIGEGTGSMSKESKHRFFIGSKRFDWRLPNSNLLFRGCNSYAMGTDDETGETVVDMQIGTAQKYLTWTQVKAEMYEIERRLIDDGWQSFKYQNGDSSYEKLQKELENPDFNNPIKNTIASTTYTKGDVSLSLYCNRSGGINDPNILTEAAFTHVAILTNISYEEKQRNRYNEDK